MVFCPRLVPYGCVDDVLRLTYAIKGSFRSTAVRGQSLQLTVKTDALEMSVCPVSLVPQTSMFIMNGRALER